MTTTAFPPIAVPWLDPPVFSLAGQSHRYFFHYHNCGWPPLRCTERCVELALTDFWLNALDPKLVLEIGSVTPYYWPRRVTEVVDPSDAHPLVTRRCSLFEVDLQSRAVLSISTLEHIGLGQYGLAPDPPQVLRAFRKVFAEARQFLVTAPIGYNPLLDHFLFETRQIPFDVALRFLVRVDEFRWREEPDPAKARMSYGDPWANSIAVLERGGLLMSQGLGVDPRPGRL